MARTDGSSIFLPEFEGLIPLNSVGTYLPSALYTSPTPRSLLGDLTDACATELHLEFLSPWTGLYQIVNLALFQRCVVAMDLFCILNPFPIPTPRSCLSYSPVLARPLVVCFLVLPPAPYPLSTPSSFVDSCVSLALSSLLSYTYPS